MWPAREARLGADALIAFKAALRNETSSSARWTGRIVTSDAPHILAVAVGNTVQVQRPACG